MKETRNLPCKLTPSELNEVGERLAHKLAEQASILARKKAATSQLDGESKVVKAEIDRLAAMRRDGVEGRDIEVAIAKDHGRYIVERLDLGIEIENRPLRPDEKQEALTFPGAGAKPGKGPLTATVHEIAKGKSKKKKPRGVDPGDEL